MPQLHLVLRKSDALRPPCLLANAELACFAIRCHLLMSHLDISFVRLGKKQVQVKRTSPEDEVVLRRTEQMSESEVALLP